MRSGGKRFVISETNFLTKLSHKFGIFRLYSKRGSTSAPAYNCRGSEGRSPLKLTTFSYFRDYFLNKIITEIWKIKTKNFVPFAGGRGQIPWQNWMGAMTGLPPLDPPLTQKTQRCHVDIENIKTPVA